MTAQSSIPLKWYVPFANGDSSRVELPVTTSDPTRASQTLGFPPLTMQPPESGGVPPQGEDFNGGMNQVARICWWVLNGGGWPYDSTFATNSNINGYPNGAKLQSADFKGDWISIADNNQNNPDTVGTGWVPGFQYGTTAVTGLTGGTTTLTPAQAAKGSITLAGTLGSAQTIILPTWLKNWTIINNTTGAYVTIVKTAAGSGVTIAQDGSRVKVVGDGTNIVADTPSNSPGRLLRTTVYRNNGGTLESSVNGGAFATASSTFTPLAATTAVDVEAVGGGGGGGGVPATIANQYAASAGAQGGAYGRGYYTSGFSGVTVAAGAAGTGGTAGANPGGNGGTSSFGALLSAPGGIGSAAGVVGANSTVLWVGPGTNTQNSATGGYINSSTTSGSYSLGSGTAALLVGQGGNTPLGAGGLAVPSSGIAGKGYGGGASGTGIGASTSALAGQPGASGAVIVREYA